MNPKVLLVANTDWYLFRFRLTLARYLVSKGYQVKMVSPSGPYVPRLIDQGFEWLEWGVDRQAVSPIGELMSLRQLTELYAAEKPTIVHHHTIKPVLYGSCAATKTGVPVIINSITGSGYVFMSNEIKARMLRPVVSFLYRKWLQSPNCAVIFENPEDRDDFLKRDLIQPHQAYLIKSVGVDTTKFTPVPEPEGIPVVTMASRMLWDKGVGVFVKAARELKNRLPVRMILAGLPDTDNPSSVPMDQMNAWSEEGVIEWIGWQEDVAALYAQSNIVALPSFYEGLPTSLIEAAACGRALITSDIRGCRDVVSHGVNGLLVKSGDPIALADAIEQLALKPKLRKDMGLRAREQVEQEFSADIVNRKTLDIYLMCLKEMLLASDPVA